MAAVINADRVETVPASPRTSSRLRITPTRRRIDDRAPFLGFTVTTGGLPYFEVLLASDRTLFDPAAASRRTPATFYASRQDGGLLPVHGDQAVYMVPPVVLRTFAGGAEPLHAIYYTVVGYTTPDGAEPTFVRPPGELADSAVSVAVARDFTGRTLAAVLGLDCDRLVRHHPTATVAQELEAVAPAVPAAVDAAADRAEGEDGASAVEAHAGSVDTLPYDDGWGPPEGGVQAAGLEWKPSEDIPDYLLDEGDEDGQPYGTAFEDAPPREPLEPASAPAPTVALLTVDDKRRIIERVARAESGDARYAAMNLDGEFRGRFGEGHPAFKRWHVGLSYGIVQFAQDPGALGRLLTMMQGRDPEVFARCFGGHADELLRVTNAPGPGSADAPNGRSARVQPVGGADLWEGPWPERFRGAAAHVPFQAAQNELAATDYLEPMLPFAFRLGLNTDRALTIAVDRSVQLGVRGAKLWLAQAVGPVSTPALMQAGLEALGQPDLRAFQATAPGLDVDGLWGPDSHAALTAALRELGAASPVPIGPLHQMLDLLAARAASERWADRVARLRAAADFDDRPFAG